MAYMGQGGQRVPLTLAATIPAAIFLYLLWVIF
jgi:hypothetical protein